MANRVRSTALIGGVAVVAVFLLMAQRGQAQTVASDRAAGYVVFPKVLVDSSDIFNQGRRVDTLIQLTNTSPSAGCQVVECFYINATKHCSKSTNGPCRTNADCAPGGTCAAPANCGGETNFWMVLSGNQPVGWSANLGGFIPPDGKCALGQTIAAAPEAFFAGEVKCVEVDGTDQVDSTGTPLLVNDLKGEATIYDLEPGSPGGLDVRAYNGVGIQAMSVSGQPIAKTCVGGTKQSFACGADGDCPGGACRIAMCLGSNPSTGAVCPAATHASCPSTLILNHFFDGAPDDVAGLPIRTDLTLVPCSEDIGVGTPNTVAQFQVFNEFEQRFSASLSVRCFREIQLSNIDTLPGNEDASIFSYSVQGTLTGQTRIRAVTGSELDVGHGLLGVAEEFIEGGSDAFNLHYAGTVPAKSDVVILPVNPD